MARRRSGRRTPSRPASGARTRRCCWSGWRQWSPMPSLALGRGPDVHAVPRRSPRAVRDQHYRSARRQDTVQCAARNTLHARRPTSCARRRCSASSDDAGTVDVDRRWPRATGSTTTCDDRAPRAQRVPCDPRGRLPETRCNNNVTGKHALALIMRGAPTRRASRQLGFEHSAMCPGCPACPGQKRGCVLYFYFLFFQNK